MKPLLAASIKDVSTLNFPVYASAKLDGVRCLIKDGQAVSRSLKPIPNLHIQRMLSLSALEGLDGELIVGDPTHPRCFNITQSAVMSINGEPDFTYHVFDRHDQQLPFHQRLFCVFADMLENKQLSYVTPVTHHAVNCAEDLLELERDLLAQGHEGVMVRDPNGSYKYGRATLKSGILLKLKRFIDSEAQIIGYKELMHNENEATKDALGHTERSSHQAGKVPAGTLGSLIVQDVTTGVEFDIGTGLTAEDRDRIWARREELLGHLVKYKSFPVGAKEKPRFPVFIGFRDMRDLS
jgi:DNA ligase-1